MVFSRKHVTSVFALLLIVLLSSTWNLSLVSASSGGVMGGSFFNSDSSSSSKSFTSQSHSSSFSKSFTSQSYSQRVKEEQNHDVHDAPSRDGDEVASGGLHPIISFLLIATGCVLVRYFYKENNVNENALTVLKLQVGMLDEMGCTIQRDLNRIAETYNTSSKEGVSCLLKETIQTLDQHHGYCIAGYSSVDLKRSEEDGEKCYNQLSIEEREKFDGETLVNLNNNNKTRIRSQSYDRSSDEYSMFDVKKSNEETEKFEKEKLLSGFNNKYIVITILVATKGVHTLPKMNGAEDLKEALLKLKSLLSSKHLLAGEVLWTPQKEDDTLSNGKLLKDYPQLAKSMKRD